MYIRIITIIFLLYPTLVLTQDMIWLKVEKGTVFHLDPIESEWVPSVKKEKIPIKTYLLTRDTSIAYLYQETNEIRCPSGAYFYIDDLFHHNRIDIISALTKIEVEQLPSNLKDLNKKQVKPIGLIYGKLNDSNSDKNKIPFEKERMNAIRWFIANKRYSAALLSLKRLVTRYPYAYYNSEYVDYLFVLYSQFELFGFLLEESTFLLNLKSSDDFQQNIKKWNHLAQQKIHTNKKK